MMQVGVAKHGQQEPFFHDAGRLFLSHLSRRGLYTWSFLTRIYPYTLIVYPPEFFGSFGCFYVAVEEAVETSSLFWRQFRLTDFSDSTAKCNAVWAIMETKRK